MVGGVSGGADYLGTTLTAAALNDSSGDPGPTVAGFAYATVGGALTGGALPLAGTVGGAAARSTAAAVRSVGAATRSFVYDTALPFAQATTRQVSRLRVEGFGAYSGVPFPRRVYLAAVDEAIEAGELTIRAGHGQIKRVISLPEIHHLASDKGPYRRQLGRLLDRAGLSFDSPFNKVRIPGHASRHGIYNQIVLERLRVVSGGKSGAELRAAVTDELLDLRYRAKKGDLLELLKAPASNVEVEHFR